MNLSWKFETLSSGTIRDPGFFFLGLTDLRPRFLHAGSVYRGPNSTTLGTWFVSLVFSYCRLDE